MFILLQLNFARFYLQSLFPTVGKIIYIDSDCLVLGEVVGCPKHSFFLSFLSLIVIA